MAYSQAKADRMNQLAQQYPRAPISTLATLANIPASEISNYTTDTISTPARNANFGRVTSVASTEVQASNTPTTSPGSGSAFTGNTVPQPTVTSPTSSTTARVNPVTGRPFTTPPQPTVTSPPSSETVTNTTGSGTAFQGGGTIASQAFRDQTPQTSPYPAPPPARPVQVQDSDVDFTDAYGENYRQATPIPAPVVESNNTEVDFADPYSENFRNPQPIPVDTRRPGTPPSPYQDDLVFDDEVNVTQPTPRPDINAPEPPPARPAQEISQVDDFGGTGITQVDDFGGAPQNVTPVDDFAEYSPPAQVDDFAEFQAPAQVDDFAEYSPPAQVDDFAEFQAPAQVDDFAEYQPPAQVDDFAEINTPAQVDDFAGYSDNDFGAEDPGLDAFGPGPEPAQVDDFAGYSNNDFGAQVDDFGEINTPAQVDDFADYSDNDFGAQVDDFGEINTPPPVDDFADYSDNDFGAEVDDFADYESPSDVNQFGVDDFGDPEAAQFDEFGTPLRAPEEVNEFGVDDFGDPEAAQFDEFGDPIRAPEDVEDFDEYGDFEDEEGEEFDAFGNRVDNEGNEDDLIVDDDPDGGDIVAEDAATEQALNEIQQSAIQAQALKEKARQQQTVSEMREASGVKNADGDWRVKLRLAPQATYLYQAQEPGILAPLTETDGIIFPYTPSIDIQYRANYQEYSPTHSNYQHYFYQGSNVAAIQLSATFTAQDTVEAEYLLAVIHFLKSCSKMFYGNDAQRGSPPPLLYLSGLGEYQFNESPCVISEFNYNLPNDVNYIRARSKQIKRDGQLQYKKPLATSVTNGNFSSLTRLKTAITNAYNGQSQPLEAAAEPYKPAPGNLGSKGATYVPTKMDITIVLNPIVSRKQVSQQFSLKEYANGNLIKKGMW